MKADRLISLDAFRGFTIASMLLVNNPGDWSNLYPQLAHAAWNGWTFTDWIFPFFLFISGVSMSLSMATKSGGLERTSSEKLALLISLAKRASIIFLIGLCLNFIPLFQIETVRILGVLQRIAICTVLAAPLVIYFTWRQQIIWIVGILLVYTTIMLRLPVPDVTGVVTAGALEPGRDVGAYIDRLLLSGHLWAKVKTWDPEGLFTTLPALCSQLFGVLTGRWLLSDGRSNNIGGDPSQNRIVNANQQAGKTVWMLLAGLAMLWLGVILESLVMPINKSLWSTSYCVFMTGWALLLFGAFYWLMDACGNATMKAQFRRLMQPLTIYGLNALFIFAMSGLVAKLIGFFKVSIANLGDTPVSIKTALFAPLKALPILPVNSSLLFAILFNMCFFVLAWFMWKKRWFIKV